MGHLEDGLCRLEAAYPKVYRHIELALGQLADARVSGEFQTVGISCRDAYITFAEQVFSPDFNESGSSVHQEQTSARSTDETRLEGVAIVRSCAHRSLLQAADEPRISRNTRLIWLRERQGGAPLNLG